MTVAETVHDVPPRLTEAQRLHELHRVFQPKAFLQTVSSQVAPPHPIISSLAQLVSLRLDVARCTISLFDANDLQYIIAEGSRTAHLDDMSKCDVPDDNVWLGCTTVTPKESTCVHVLHVKPDERQPFLEIFDMSSDPRFNHLGYVKGPAHVRYYYGVPIETRNGARIGVLAAYHNETRPPMSKDMRTFMQLMSENVYQYLDSLRDEQDRKRIATMSKCLNAFVDADYGAGQSAARTRTRARSQQPFAKPKTARHALHQSKMTPSKLENKKSSFRTGFEPASGLHSVQTSDKSTVNAEDSSSESSADLQTHGSVSQDDDSREMFKNAAYLLGTALDLHRGGVVFLDTMPSTKSAGSNLSDSTDVDKSPYNGSHHSQRFKDDTARVLARHYTPEHSSREDDRDGIAALAMSSFSLQNLNSLIKKYPTGKLFAVGPDGSIWSSDTSDSDDAAEDLDPLAKRNEPIGGHAEFSALLDAIPHVRNVVFVPFLDPSTSRYCACFAYTTSDYKVFSYESEFLFSRAFCNCVSAQQAQLASVLESQKKGDFISSISHELRSPLHGIHASCEFLADTPMDDFQHSLSSTIHSCAQTLLDTLNQVLDFSKINSFERDFRRVDRRGKTIPHYLSLAQNSSEPVQPMMSIYGKVDLAAITEEVVEGVQAGHAMLTSPTLDFSDMGRSNRGKTSERGHVSSPSNSLTDIHGSVEGAENNVEILLDIAPADWTFITQPGAWRRIVMNILGNALKYTKGGWISIRLEQKSMREAMPEQSHVVDNDDSLRAIVLVIADTGKGISPDFLRNRAFTAFAQEDTLAAGTGLGLSLVKSLLNMLGGTIDIASSPGAGTTVTIRLPMKLVNHSAETTPSTDSTSSSVRQDSISELRQKNSSVEVSIFSSSNSRHPASSDRAKEATLGLLEIIQSYIANWYCLSSHKVSRPDASKSGILVVDDSQLPDALQIISLFEQSSALRSNLLIVVACENSSRNGNLKALVASKSIFCISKPIGPYKLAKALEQCIDRLAGAEGSSPGPLASSLGSAQHSLVLEGTLSSGSRTIPVWEVNGVVVSETANATKACSTSLSTPLSTPDDEHLTPLANRPPLHQQPISREDEFPFPQNVNEGDGNRLYPSAATTQPAVDYEMRADRPHLSSVASANNRTDKKAVSHPSTIMREPRVLLVDDNVVNLRLLHMFMKKRKYDSSNITLATNGLEAVQAFESAPLQRRLGAAPFDVVFMDLSMPVMDGYQATKSIRLIEEQRNAGLNPLDRRATALIIAVTGLASERDQVAAFDAGVDLYMSKPVSFKEVARFLDGWETSNVAQPEVPHGPLSGKIGGTTVEEDLQRRR